MLNFVDGLDNVSYQAGMDQVIAALPHGFGGGIVAHGGYKADSGIKSNHWTEHNNGEEYQDTLRAGSPDIQIRANDLRTRVEAVNADFASRYGWNEANPTRATYAGNASVVSHK